MERLARLGRLMSCSALSFLGYPVGYFVPLFIYYCSLFYYDGSLIQTASITESFPY